MLYDSHIHFIPKELSVHTAFYKGIWTDKEKLFNFLEENQITTALLGYPATEVDPKIACQIYNSSLEEVIKENSKIIASGIVNLDDLASLDFQVRQLKQRGFRAISIGSSHKGKFLVKELEPMFQAAQEEDLPIFVHPQTINPIGFERVKDPLLMPVLEYSFDSSMFMGLLMMEGIFEKYKVKFIFSSLGGVVPFLKDRFDRVYTMLRKREIVKDLGRLPTEILKNVYVDTSGASLNNIQLALDLFGADKLLWGSDYPVCGDIQGNLKMLDGLGQNLKENITHKNFQSIFS
jgi:predicted TIM-barrel fold metal-dependent hydrolase